MLTIIKQRLLKKIFLGKEQYSNKLEYLYFGYGANSNPNFFSKRIKNFEVIGSANLTGFKLAFNVPCEYVSKGYAGIVNDSENLVYGTLYKISREGLELLDVLEWVDFGFYHRDQKQITYNGKDLLAHIYIPTNPREGLLPSKGYLNMLLSAGKALGYPEDYLEYLATHDYIENFKLDHGFNLADPSKPRLFPVQMYELHDILREKLCNII